MMKNGLKRKDGQVIWAWFPVTLLTAIFCCVLWGSASPAIKIAYELFRIIIGSLMGGTLTFYTAGCTLNLIYMGFISAGAYTLWGILLKYNPVSRISILGFVNPVMGVLLSALFLGEGREAFSLTGLLALLLVSCGIIIVNAGNSKDQ